MQEPRTKIVKIEFTGRRKEVEGAPKYLTVDENLVPIEGTNEQGYEITLNTYDTTEPSAFSANIVGLPPIPAKDAGFVIPDPRYGEKSDPNKQQVFVGERPAGTELRLSPIREIEITLAMLAKPDVARYLAYTLKKDQRLEDNSAKYYLTDTGKLYILYQPVVSKPQEQPKAQQGYLPADRQVGGSQDPTMRTRGIPGQRDTRKFPGG